MLHAASSTLGPADTAAAPVPISVVVLSCNKEHSIADCLESCRWCDDVHLLDGGSGDRTSRIAHAMGASVHYNPFESLGQQRNWAIDHVPCKHPWHFHLDAGERFTPKLVAELAREVGCGGTRSAVGAYRCPSKMIFMGRWIRHSSGYPDYQVRLFNPRHCRFVDLDGRQQGACAQCDREVGTLINAYIHYECSRGMIDWLEKHNHDSSHEADEVLAADHRGKPRRRDLLGRDPASTRRAISDRGDFGKGRGLWRFLSLYLLRAGFLDGMPGFHYCTATAMYEYWLALKIRERREPWTEATDRLTADLLKEPS